MKKTKEQKIKGLEKKLRQVKVLIDTLTWELNEAKIRQEGLLKELCEVKNEENEEVKNGQA